jgi:SAM-dependent methyltransferase
MEIKDDLAPAPLFVRLRGSAAAAPSEQFIHRFLKDPRTGGRKLTTILEEAEDDPTTLVKIRALCEAPRRQPQQGRGGSRIRDIQQALDTVKKVPDLQYLDIGCSEGQITSAVAKHLKLPKGRAHACDVVDVPAGPFTFTKLEDEAKLPYATATFGLVTMFMSAHHFRDCPAMFAEARRVMKPGALLVMREHDCRSPDRAIYYDVVHAIYACVATDEIAPAAFRGIYAEYRPIAGWVAALEEAGFAKISSRIVWDKMDACYLIAS